MICGITTSDYTNPKPSTPTVGVLPSTMGYTTDFWGDGFTITPEPSEDIVALINGLASTRRMKRDMSKLFPGEDVSIYGTEGEFYYNPETTNFGQEEDVSILEYNYPPRTQPGLWLQWQYNTETKVLEWDGGEKFYNYVKWMQYLIDKILEPKGYVVNGEVEWQGESPDDRGKMTVVNNQVSARQY